MGDLFDACLDLEDQHIAEGHSEGVGDGRAAGLAEGRELGQQKGAEIGTEVGFYAGFCQALRQARAEHAEALERVDRQVAAIEELVSRFPLTDPKDESMQDIMVELRGKYRAVCAKLGIPEKRLSLGTSIQVPAVSLDF